ncbi:hypothetical protein BH11CYA1_BH11CYA1_38840 [soil metagenome]
MPDLIPDNKNLGTLEVGSFIGGTYRVLDFIGQGGMGFVYKVEHMMMAKVLALKLLRSEQVSEDVWKRFRIEAQAIARLDHSNVVRIYDMSQTEAGLPYYTMDLLVGQSLADYLDEYYRLPLREALPIFRQVCAGLAYAHDRGIIHRDIKPGNIMLLPDGRENAPPFVKIVDFGIAKLSSFDNGFGQGLTRPGEVFGSPLYMSPEQCSGQQLDHRTDMYSVGVTMFQALTGRPPLLGKTAIETIAMHQSVVPPAMTDVIILEDDEKPIVFPPELEEIVARLLAKSPAARYDSLADVATDLLALERSDGRRARVSSTAVDVVSSVSGMAPYAVAEAARRRANYSTTQVLTSGQSDTDSALGGNKQAKLILIAGASLLLISSLAAVGAVFLMQKKTVAADTAPKITRIGPFDVPVPKGAMAKFDNNTDDFVIGSDVDVRTTKQIKDYLDTHKEPYSKIEEISGLPMRVFNFPADFRIGSLTCPKSGIPSYETIEAIGRVSLPMSTKVAFHGAPSVKAYPDLLKYFRADEPYEIDLNEIESLSPRLAVNLKRFTNLKRLELKGTKLKPSDVTWLNELTSLKQLSVDDSGLPGASLAQCAILPNLFFLGMSRIDNPTPVLKKLAEINHLTALEINFSKLEHEDVLYIAKMSNLASLCCRENDIVDSDVEEFLKLKELRVLDLSRCNKLTPKALVTIGKMKALEALSLPDFLAEPENEQVLRKQLPRLQHFS